MTKKIFSLDSQILNEIQMCATKAKYAIIEKLRPKIKAPYFETGDLMHKLLAEYYTCLKNKKTWEEAVESARSTFLTATHEMEIEVETQEEVLKHFLDYTIYFRGELWTPLTVEEPFSKIIYDSEDYVFLYEGKPDLIVQTPNGVAPVDHKTSKRRADPSKRSNQFIGYCWATGTQTIVINKVGFQKTLKPAERFLRYPKSYDKEIIEEWVNNTIWWIKFLIYCIEEDNFPMNFTSCDKWDGCVYAKICDAAPNAREWVKKTEFRFEEKEWDVAKELEEAE